MKHTRREPRITFRMVLLYQNANEITRKLFAPSGLIYLAAEHRPLTKALRCSKLGRTAMLQYTGGGL